MLLPGFPAPLDERPLRGELSRGMILAEDEIGLGSDHAGIMLLPDGIEPGTPLADVLPVREQVLDATPTMNRVDLLSMVGLAREVATLFDGELIPIESSTRRSCIRSGSRSGRDPDGCPRYLARVLPDVDDRAVADVAAGTAPRRRDALDLERRRRHELRHARLRKPAARIRPVELAGGRIVVRHARAGEEVRDARRNACAASTSATC